MTTPQKPYSFIRYVNKEHTLDWFKRGGRDIIGWHALFGELLLKVCNVAEEGLVCTCVVFSELNYTCSYLSPEKGEYIDAFDAQIFYWSDSGPDVDHRENNNYAILQLRIDNLEGYQPPLVNEGDRIEEIINEIKRGI